MAAKTWIGTTNGLWSVATNWVEAAVPATTDDVTFNVTGTARACTIDNLGTFSGGTITIDSAYANTITQNTGINLTVGAFSMASGTFTCHAAATFTATAFSVTAGTFNQGGAFVCTTFGVTSTGIYVGSSATMATTVVTFSGTSNLTATSGVWTINGNFTQTNTPTFSANGGTITLAPQTAFSTATLTAPTLTFNLITVNCAANASVTIAAGTTAPLGASPSVVGGGNFTATGTISFTGTLAFSSVGGSGIFTVSSGATVTGADTTVQMDNGNFTNIGGTLPSGFSVTFNITNSTARLLTNSAGGTYSGTVRRTGSGTGMLTLAGTCTIGTLRDNDGTVANTIVGTAGNTYTITTFSVAGAEGKLVTLRSTAASSVWTMTAAGAQSADYILIQDSTVSASPVWTAGANSLDGGGNTNWVFTDEEGGAPAAPAGTKSFGLSGPTVAFAA